jgi:hypothetical protein
MNNSIKFMSLAAVASAMLFSSCKKDENPAPVVSSKDNTVFFVSTTTNRFYDIISDLFSGKKSVINAREGNFPDFQSSKFFYDKLLSVKAGTAPEFGIFKLANNDVTQESRLLLASGASEFNWCIFDAGNSNVIVVQRGYYKPGDGIPYRTVNVSSQAIQKSGTLNFPQLPNSLVWCNSVIAKEGKYYVNYIHADKDSYIHYDTAYTAVFDQNLSFEKIIKDTRTASTGFNDANDHVFNASGDLYLSTSNSDYWGVNEKLPSGILRIKKGESNFDPAYFFNITEKVNGNHAVGLMPIGNNKAITYVFRKDLIKTYDDFYKSFTVEHWIIDLSAGTAKKIELPLHKYPQGDPIPTKDGKFALKINSQEGSFIYTLDPTSGAVTKGIQYEGVDRIDNLLPII